MAYDKNKDYMADLKGDELFDSGDGKKLVYLAGLERLAKERGIKEQRSRVISSQIDFAAVTVSYLFEDNSHYEGSADAHKANCSKNFDKYLLALCESRAKARALRNAFHITACSVEEIGPTDSPPSTDAQHGLIKHLMKEKGMLLKGAFELIKVEDADELGQLTKDEASKLINKLQKVKVK